MRGMEGKIGLGIRGVRDVSCRACVTQISWAKPGVGTTFFRGCLVSVPPFRFLVSRKSEGLMGFGKTLPRGGPKYPEKFGQNKKRNFGTSLSPVILPRGGQLSRDDDDKALGLGLFNTKVGLTVNLVIHVI